MSSPPGRVGAARAPGGARGLYGAFAWAYDAVVPEPAGGAPAAVARRLRALGAPAGALVIDAGCGTGRYARGMAEHGFRVIGVDRSPALLAEARRRAPAARFVCADLTAWRPSEPAGAVLCRGVLNDLLEDAERRAAFAALAAWLAPGGVLLADVREWLATAARYAGGRRLESTAARPGRTLAFSSETELDARRRLLLVRERYAGTIDGVRIDEQCDFAMRPWTADAVRAHAAEAGFASADVRVGAAAGVAPDRLLLVARR